MLATELDVEVTEGALDTTKYEKLSNEVMDLYPNVSVVAITLRESKSVILDVGCWFLVTSFWFLVFGICKILEN